MRLKDKVAIVTGGAMGIGKGIVRRLAENGADVAIADVDDEAARRTAEEVGALDVKTTHYHCDVSIKADVQAMMGAVVSDFGDFDILVNNAGVLSRSTILDLEEDEWDRVLAVNLKGHYLCTREAALHWVRKGRRGKIVNLSSTMAEGGGVGVAHYSASKGGVRMFTRSVALDLGPYQINVNAVGPGGIPTEIANKTAGHLGAPEGERSPPPIGIIGRPEDIGAAVVFLASDEADYITGHTIMVDGGRSIALPGPGGFGASHQKAG